jgi:glycopeptide antibiotics resistance protein
LGGLVVSNGVLSLGVSGTSGPDYILLETTNLVPPVIWHALGTNLAATLPFSFSIPTTNPGANFYRLQLGP